MSEIWKWNCCKVSYTILERVESVLFVLVIAPPVKRWGSVYISPCKIEKPSEEGWGRGWREVLNVFCLRKVLVELDSIVDVFSVEIKNIS